MNLIDEQYTKTPFFGTPKMTGWLRRKGHLVNRKRIRRLMALMGISAVYPHPNTSIPNKEHKVYPYLLRDIEITRVNQVWSTDITYVRLMHGFLYLVAIMDWFSRYVIAWQISNTLDSVFCEETLKESLNISNPEIFNTDQGTQFTSNGFTKILLDRNIKISMDSKGRALDNIFIERLWRSLKYEDVYLKNYETVPETIKGISKYFEFYNNERPHQSLDYATPAEIFINKNRR